MKKNKPEIKITQKAYNEINDTVGTFPPETGGILLGKLEDGIVREFIYDKNGHSMHAGYDPDVDFLNEKLEQYRKSHGYDYLGSIHSHPTGCNRLSGDMGNGIGDIGYLKRIFDAFTHLSSILTPIVFSSQNGIKEFFPYVAFRDDVENYQLAELKIVSDDYKQAIEEKVEIGLPIKAQEKLEGSVDYQLMQDTHVVCVGIGGANAICEDLVRTGLGKLTVIDFDTVDESNLSTQGFCRSDVGKLKVDALKDRLLRINPSLEFISIAKDFTEINKKQLDSIMKDAKLLLMMTDKFPVQAYGNKAALKYQLPTVFAIMYEKAQGCEISFSIPGITKACHRCATSSRYEAYQEDSVNHVTSNGSTIFHTRYINSVIGLLSLAIIHRDEPGVEFSNWFGGRWDRNLIQFRLHPDFGTDSDTEFEHRTKTDGNLFVFDPMWHSIEPESSANASEPCLDCGGVGDLQKVSASIKLHKDPFHKEEKALMIPFFRR